MAQSFVAADVHPRRVYGVELSSIALGNQSRLALDERVVAAELYVIRNAALHYASA